MDTNIGFVYCTCDNYDDVWDIFFKKLKLFWPQMNIPIYICTESKKYTYEGLNIKCPLSDMQENLTSWSYRLLKLLDSIPEEYVLFMLDDFIITQPVIHDVVEKSYSFLKANRDVGYICLHKELSENSNEIRKQHAVKAEIPELHQCIKGMPYRITTQAGIWRKNYLMKLLKSHENAWQFEVRGNTRANIYYNSTKIYDVNDAVVEYPAGGIIWRGRFQKEYVDLFEKSEIETIINKRGLITREELNMSQTARKKTIRDYWNYFLSYLPF